ncbi:M48 family metallopeptidase [Psychrosphaera haliotis]|uniref:M48 family metallopeptidase n=1 Tax=Psychrosphaera haliotis TaxID=555083 RepID=UPI0031CEA223
MISELLAPWRTAKHTVKPGAFFISLTSFEAPLPYTVKVHQRRKRLAIEIHQGEVVVKAPLLCTHNLVETFLNQQQRWLKARLTIAATKPSFIREYKNGEPIWFMGKPLELKVVKTHQTSWHYLPDQNTLMISLSGRVKNRDIQVRQQLHQFYLHKAQQYLPTLLKQCEDKTRLSSTALEFKFYQWRWGCCYNNGKIILNPLLMAAPESAIECVIIHELCHRKHMNHSKQFWQLNAEFCDECGQTKNWLKAHHDEVYLPTPK